MTKEELEKEAIEFEENHSVYEVAKREDGSEYAKKVCSVTIKQAYLAGAEPREKRIAELEEISTRLESYYQNQKVRIAELEAQIEKMKCCQNCRKFNNLSYDCTCAEVCNEWELRR